MHTLEEWKVKVAYILKCFEEEREEVLRQRVYFRGDPDLNGFLATKTYMLVGSIQYFG